MNKLGEGRFQAYGAGSHPRGAVHPMALSVLSGHGFDAAGMRSKSWDEFALPDSPVFDFIFTVCGDAAGGTCPVWMGRPMTAHWGIEDPAAVEGEGQRAAFLQALPCLNRRIELFLPLPHASIDAMAMKRKLKEIGQGAGTSAKAGQAE